MLIGNIELKNLISLTLTVTNFSMVTGMIFLANQMTRVFDVNWLLWYKTPNAQSIIVVICSKLNYILILNT